MTKDEKRSWDEAAGDYQKVFALGLSDYSAALLRFWREEGMIRPGCRVLDIGCGVGKYGTYLAELGCDVTLTDLSDEMIRQAERNMAGYGTPWRAYACDFHTATGLEPVFAGGFDFVFSTMSPAIDGAEAVRKMSALSRSWCFLARFQSWEQPTRDALMRTMGIEPRPMMDRLSDDVAAMIRSVGEAGFTPRVEYVPYDWADERSPEEMADYLCRRYFEPEERERLYPAARTAAAGLAGPDGLVHDAVNTSVAWICWRT
ncbi:MAG: class I SAM-dependent methyltransferase [Oscillospiraceae bacterium]|nr:class I SAM-dependent methyltransferase [Oscillospiraceae bacterium]